MPEDPIGTFFANMAQTFNMLAPHTVIPKMLAAMTPQAPTQPGGQAAMAQGAGLGGVPERQALRTGTSIEELQARQAANQAASIKSGYSVTGSTIFM